MLGGDFEPWAFLRAPPDLTTVMPANVGTPGQQKQREGTANHCWHAGRCLLRILAGEGNRVHFPTLANGRWAAAQYRPGPLPNQRWLLVGGNAGRTCPVRWDA